MLKKPMFTKLFNHFSGKITLFLILLLTTNQCGIYKKTDARKVPTNAKERVKKLSNKSGPEKFNQNYVNFSIYLIILHKIRVFLAPIYKTD